MTEPETLYKLMILYMLKKSAEELMSSMLVLCFITLLSFEIISVVCSILFYNPSEL